MLETLRVVNSLEYKKCCAMKMWKLINNRSEYTDALVKAIETVSAEPGTDEFEEREFLLVLIKDYEERSRVNVPVAN